MDTSSTADKIKRLRLEHGLTLEQVAQVVGVGKSTVRKWETGMIENMRRDKIAKLAIALSTTPEYLMGWDDIPSGPGDKKEPAPQDELSDIDKQFMDILSGMSEAEKEKLLTLCKVYGIESISDLYGICSPGPALSSNESALLSGFRDLNEEGQEKVLSYVEDLNRAGIYKRDSKTGLVQDS